MPRKAQTKNATKTTATQAAKRKNTGATPTVMGGSRGNERKMASEPTQELKRPMLTSGNGPSTMAAANVKTDTSPQNNGNAQTPQVIPFRQPGWDRHSEALAKHQQEVRTGFAKVASRFNHSRGK